MESAISDIAPFLGMGVGAEILYTLGQKAYDLFRKGYCPSCSESGNPGGCEKCGGTGTANGYMERRSKQ
jgi:hypothetical protein